MVSRSNADLRPLLYEQMRPVTQLLVELENLQSKGDSGFPKGIFPSYRFHPWVPYKRPDDNLFCTALVVYTLQSCFSFFTGSDRAIVERITERAKPAYPLFANKDGKNTFNFWQTKPSRHFPNGYFMHRMEHFRIPDDADDTAYVALTSNYNSEQATALRQRLVNHAANVKRPIYNTWPEYRHLKAYSTFFGEKMYIEFDACVLTNVLLFIHRHFDELNEHERDAYSYLTDVVKTGKHRTDPFHVASNYPTTLLIVYHMARLLHHVPKSALSVVKDELINDALGLFETAHGLEKIVASTALHFLGVPHQPVLLDQVSLAKSPFYFFHAGMLTAFEAPFVHKYMAPSSAVHLRYESRAINLVLMIENGLHAMK